MAYRVQVSKSYISPLNSQLNTNEQEKHITNKEIATLSLILFLADQKNNVIGY